MIVKSLIVLPLTCWKISCTPCIFPVPLLRQVFLSFCKMIILNLIGLLVSSPIFIGCINFVFRFVLSPFLSFSVYMYTCLSISLFPNFSRSLSFFLSFFLSVLLSFFLLVYIGLVSCCLYISLLSLYTCLSISLFLSLYSLIPQHSLAFFPLSPYFSISLAHSLPVFVFLSFFLSFSFLLILFLVTHL